jgi:hypothetical protein
MPNFPTIESFFPRIESPSGNKNQNHNRHRDGFTDAEMADLSPPATSQVWAPKDGKGYRAVKIGEISPGAGRVKFTGRIGNLREHENKSKSVSAAKVLLRLTVMDETGAIEVSI